MHNLQRAVVSQSNHNQLFFLHLTVISQYLTLIASSTIANPANTMLHITYILVVISHSTM